MAMRTLHVDPGERSEAVASTRVSELESGGKPIKETINSIVLGNVG